LAPFFGIMMLLSFLQWGGVSCCSLGGLLALLGVAKGRQARELSTATQVENLAGEGWLSEGAEHAVLLPPLPPPPLHSQAQLAT
jgi:hypothetical protein